MNELIRESVQKARKNYSCDSCDWINPTLCDVIFDMTFTEKRQLVTARKNKYKILKGDSYIKQVGKLDGEIYTVRCIPEMHEICLKHNLYEA